MVSVRFSNVGGAKTAKTMVFSVVFNCGRSLVKNHSFWPKTAVFSVVFNCGRSQGLKFPKPQFSAENCGFQCGFQLWEEPRSKTAKNCGFQFGFQPKTVDLTLKSMVFHQKPWFSAQNHVFCRFCVTFEFKTKLVFQNSIFGPQTMVFLVLCTQLTPFKTI